MAAQAELERIRLEEEAIQAERDKQKAIADDLRERRPVERSAVKTLWDALMVQRLRLVQEVEDQREWQHYLACEDLPSPNDAPSTNTFISLWLETEYTSDFDVDCALQGFRDVTAVSASLQKYIQDKSMDGDLTAATNASELLVSVNDSIMIQINKITAKLLQYADTRGYRTSQDLQGAIESFFFISDLLKISFYQLRYC